MCARMLTVGISEILRAVFSAENNLVHRHSCGQFCLLSAFHHLVFTSNPPGSLGRVFRLNLFLEISDIPLKRRDFPSPLLPKRAPLAPRRGFRFLAPAQRSRICFYRLFKRRARILGLARFLIGPGPFGRNASFLTIHRCVLSHWAQCKVCTSNPG
jgi:hypothetical protein